MTNVEEILSTFDKWLTEPTSLVIYGRAAITLGFENPPAAAAQTLDVDAIIPVTQLPALQENLNFWEAQQATNAELEKKGLYMTHLFRSDEVFLRRAWEQFILPVSRPPTRHLQLFRPATLDLILTKMMRGDDPQDMSDVAFMIRHDSVTEEQIEEAFRDAVIPDMVELRDAFERAKPVVRKLVSDR